MSVSTSTPSSSSLKPESSRGYQGLAAIAGNLAASLSDVLGSDTDDFTLVTEDDLQLPQHDAWQEQQAQHAQHSLPHHYRQETQQAQQAHSTEQGQQAQQPQQAAKSEKGKQPQLAVQGKHSFSLKEAAPAISAPPVTHAVAAHAQPAAAPAVDMLLGTVSSGPDQESADGDGCFVDRAVSSSPLELQATALAQRLQDRAAAAMALSEAATAPSSIVSGLTDLQQPMIGHPAPVTEAAIPQASTGSTDLQARAAAAMAALEAATAASSIVSGLTDLRPPAGDLPAFNQHTVSQAAASQPAVSQPGAGQAIAAAETVEATCSTTSGLSEIQGRAAAAAALSDAHPGAASSTLSDITELAAAGASMVELAAGLATGANPFGLSSAHSVDGYALSSAVSRASSAVSGMTGLLRDPSAPAAAKNEHAVAEPEQSSM